MAQGFPLPAGTMIAAAAPPPVVRGTPRADSGSLRYPRGGRTRASLALAAALSASLHLALVFGVRRQAPAATASRRASSSCTQRRAAEDSPAASPRSASADRITVVLERAAVPMPP